MSHKRNRHKEEEVGDASSVQMEDGLLNSIEALQATCERLHLSSEYRINSSNLFTVVLDGVDFATAESQALAARLSVQMLEDTTCSTVPPATAVEKKARRQSSKAATPPPLFSPPAVSPSSSPSPSPLATISQGRKRAAAATHGELRKRSSGMNLSHRELRKTSTSMLHEFCEKHRMSKPVFSERTGRGGRVHVVAVLLDGSECGVGSGISKTTARHNGKDCCLTSCREGAYLTMFAAASSQALQLLDPSAMGSWESPPAEPAADVSRSLGTAQFSALLYSLWQIDDRLQAPPEYVFCEAVPPPKDAAAGGSRHAFTCYAKLTVGTGDEEVRQRRRRRSMHPASPEVSPEACETSVCAHGDGVGHDDDCGAAEIRTSLDEHLEAVGRLSSCLEARGDGALDGRKSPLEESSEPPVMGPVGSRCGNELCGHGGKEKEQERGGSGNSCGEATGSELESSEAEEELTRSLGAAQLGDRSASATTLTVVGWGATKREAKHEASKAILLELFECRDPEEAIRQAVTVRRQFVERRISKRTSCSDPQRHAKKLSSSSTAYPVSDTKPRPHREQPKRRRAPADEEEEAEEAASAPLRSSISRLAPASGEAKASHERTKRSNFGTPPQDVKGASSERGNSP